MTLLEEAKAHMEKMKEHTDCCGMLIFRRMTAELERITGNAKCEGCRAGLALCMDYNCTTLTPRKYHMTPNGVSVAHTE